MNDAHASVISKRWRAYLVKAALLVALLYIVSRLAPAMPVWFIAATWALLSLVPATGLAYHAVIDKTFNQKKFREGVARFTATRVVFFVAFYAVSAFCCAGLLIGSPEWGLPMWVAIVLAVPLYIGVNILVRKVVNRLSAPLFIESCTAFVSAIATGILLFVVFVLLTCLQPPPSYSCAASAFLAAPKPFSSSPSALMSEMGDLAALVSGLSSYALAKAAETSYTGYVIWQAVIEFGAFSSIASMLAVCSIKPGELKRVFQQLGNPDDDERERPVLRSYVAASVILPLVLVVGFVCADSEVQAITGAQQYTKVKDYIKQQVSLVVYEFDGKYYNPDVVNDLLERAKEDSSRISAEAEETLVPLINASFDKRVENVDSYLDWYYGLFSDWEHLASMITGDVEEFAKQKLEERIESGIDDSELNDKIEGYLKQAEDLQDTVRSELSKYEVTEPFPEWIKEDAKPLDAVLTTSLEPTQQFLSANERIGISLAAGAVAAVVVKKLVAKIATKTVFKTIVSRVTGVAATSAAGSAGGPVGVLGAAAVSMAADIAMKKLDELRNRDAYRDELVSAINEQREEMLSAVRSSTAMVEAE